MSKETPSGFSNLGRECAPTVSRRQFLKGMAAFSGAILMNQVLPINEVEAQTPEVPTPQFNSHTIPSREANLQQVRDELIMHDLSLLDTAKETAVFTLGNAVVNTMAIKTGLPITPGSEHIKNRIRENPGKLFAEGVVVAPIIEEGMFRLIPNMLLRDRTKRKHWEIGIPISLAFGYIHNLSNDDDPNKFTFTKNRFPLSAFNFGLFSWKVMRERGYWHAVTAHATANAAIISTRALLYRLMPEKMEQYKKGSGYDDPRNPD